MTNQDLHACYIRGFKDGASCQARKKSNDEHPEKALRNAYRLGYAFGSMVFNAASLQATHFYEHTPSVTKD